MLEIKNLILIGLALLIVGYGEVGFASSQQCQDLMATNAPKKTLSARTPKKKPTEAKALNPAKKFGASYILTAADLEQANIKDERSATKSKVDEYDQALLSHKIELIKHVEWVEKTLKTRYQGWDDQITKMMSSIKSLVLHNESNDRLSGPIVIPLMTFPGYGKTSVVIDLIELLAKHKDFEYLATVFDRIAINEGTGWIDLQLMEQAGTTSVDPLRPISRVIFYDEIQNLLNVENLNAIKEMDALNQASALQAIQKAMGLATAPTLAQVLEKRQEMINSVWSIFGNGRAPRIKNKDLQTYVRLLQGTAAQVESLAGPYKIAEAQIAVQSAEIAAINFDGIHAAYQANPRDEELIKRRGDAYAKDHTAKDLLRQAQTQIDGLNRYGVKHANNPVGVKSYVSKQIKEILVDYPDFLKRLGFKTIEEFADAYWLSPSAMDERMMQTLMSEPTDTLQDYRRMIVFIAGNPTSSLDDIMMRAQVDPRTLDPDSLYRLSKSTSTRLTTRFFEGLFGKTEAMKSRLKMDDWNLIAPFTSNQWNKLVHRRIERVNHVFHDTLEKVTYPEGMSLDLKIDDTVADFLRTQSISAIGGPRVFMKASEGYLAILESNLPLTLMNLPKEHRAWKSNKYEVIREIAANEAVPAADSDAYEYLKVRLNNKPMLVKHWHEVSLHVSYKAATNSFHVIEATGKKDAVDLELSLGEKLEQVKAVEGAKIAPTLSRVRNAYFQAARAVLGMKRFHSVPNLITDGNTTADHSLPEMWSVTNRESLDYWILEAEALMSGFVIEKTQPQLARNKQSDLTRTELVILATSVLDKIADELISRDKYASFLKDVERESTDLDDILPKDLAKNPIFEYAFDIDRKNASEVTDPLSAIRAPMKRKILKYLHREVSRTLADQTLAVDAIAAHLLEKGSVESETAKAIIENYHTKRPKIWNFWKSAQGAAAKKAILSGQPGAALVLETPGMSKFDYETVQRSLWSTLSQMFTND